MPLPLAERSRLISPSATIAMAAEARRLKAEGVEVLDFTLGEPDFDTPDHIREAAHRAIREGKTHYTPASGIPELRQAVAAFYTTRKDLPTEPGQVIISNGAKHSLHNALMALCGPGDEVVIPAPYWVSYADLVRLTGAVPIIVETTEAGGFKITPDQLRSAITPKTRLFMINSPSNPTGVVYDRAELEALADVVLETGIAVLTDEIYEDLVYEGAAPTCFATIRPELAERTVTVSGVSKSYAMTGWRIGWAIAPPEVAAFMGTLQSQETSNPCSISQYAALAAVTGPREPIEAMRQQFARRREYVVGRFAGLPDVSFVDPRGAFYVFFNVSRHFGRTLGGLKVDDSVGFCRAALKSAHVALVMGSAFGAEGYARMSFATDLETLRHGMDALDALLRS